MDPRVLDKMLPYMTGFYGNPHSRTHQYGWESEEAVEKARSQIAKLIGAEPKEGTCKDFFCVYNINVNNIKR